MTNHRDVEKILSKTSFRVLTDEEKTRAWGTIVRATTRSRLVLIPKPMITSLIIALALVFGAGGTAALADSAAPGDALFGIDRAVENIRLSLAGEEKKNELRIKFADERVKEVEKLSSTSPSTERPETTAVTETTVTEIEADIFTNETVVKIEYSDKKFVFATSAKTKETIVEEIVKTFPLLSKSFVEATLDLKTEDRASREEDKRVRRSADELSDNTKIRVTTGVAAALTLLNGVSTSLEGDAAVRLKAITDELNDYLKLLPQDATVETRIKNTDQKTRVDLRTEEGRIRVEVRDDGEVRIKSDDDDNDKGWDKDDSKEDDSDDDKDDDTRSDAVVRGLEIEADIFTNETVVKVELNDRKSTFTTDADTRAEIVAAVLARYTTLTSAQVEAALKIEIEDRISGIKDLTNSGGGDDSDEDSKDNEDNDKDDDKDDHSGRGRGGDDDENDD